MAAATSSDSSAEDDDAYSVGTPGLTETNVSVKEDHPSQPVADIRETVSVLGSGNNTSSPPRSPSHIPFGYNVDSELDEADPLAIMSPRAYQLEMLQKSLKHNVIVAMGTGSGKTQVAVLRIKAEMEKLQSDKIVWFLAPTVSLCEQQFNVLQVQISSCPIRLLTGNENVDTWSGKIWQTVLNDVRIVVSTYQVLLDALTHAFVTMNHLSLIVFDEAHNCVGKHPATKIMSSFYHRDKSQGSPVPSILGLTATPSMRSNVKDLETLEILLDARCTSPTLHREALLSCIKKPKVTHILYDENETPIYTPAMRALQRAFLDMDITRDPYIMQLKADSSDRSRRTLEKVFQKFDTYCQNQMKGFWTRSVETCRQLGTWAADFYIWKATDVYLSRMRPIELLDQRMRDEQVYLSEALEQVAVITPPPGRPQSIEDISDKARVLLELLAAAESGTVCILFAKERTTVAMLCHLLSSSPAVLKKFHIGAMVGTSNHQVRRRAIYEFLGKEDLQALQSFQSGKINLLVATAVLEEGIDVPACNLVICFDTPSTPRAFIQRRGRARMRESELVIIAERCPIVLDQWTILEKEMDKIYQDEEREIGQLERIEASDLTGTDFFEVEATGARLDFDNAKPHLEHFCRILCQGEFVDSRPDYILNHAEDDEFSDLSCTVLLPSVVPVELRKAESSRSWKSEKNAMKDAAFQAYVALYKAGFLSDNLLPFTLKEIPGIESRVPDVVVEQPFQPWKRVGCAWREPVDKWLYKVDCYEGPSMSHLTGQYEMILPIQLSQPRPVHTYISDNRECLLQFDSGRAVNSTELKTIPDHTSTLLALHYMHRWEVEEKEHVVRFVVPDEIYSMSDIACLPFVSSDEDVKNGKYLIRDTSRSPHLYEDVIASKPSPDLVRKTFMEYEKAPDDVPYLILSKWTRRSDVLHHLHHEPDNETASPKPYSRVFPLPWARVDAIPVKHAQFGMLIPSLIHEMEVNLVAKELSETILAPVGIKDVDLVREAISSRGAAEPLHYERLEFLGDSILKYCASIRASVENPNWPEGYLSYFKDRIVSNSHLYQAAVEMKVAKFILTKSFTGQKWRPLYLDDVLQQDNVKARGRKLPTKLLADVVEALIGASFADGGIPKALQCIRVFLGGLEWQDVQFDRQFLFDTALAHVHLPSTLEPVEEMIGYTFTKKSLLIEAMTHASNATDLGQRSFERLEFLGDAVLDYVIVTKLFSVHPPLPHHKMHMLKTAMVNSDFVAFVMLEHRLKRSRPVVTPSLNVVQEDVSCGLWSFMRHGSLAIGLEQEALVNRHAEMRSSIIEVMRNGHHYPWAPLARLQAKKFFCDLFEALLGAIWIDSGSVEECEAFLARFGITGYLDRLLRDQVNVQHPKEEIGRWALSQTVNYMVEVEEHSDGEKEYKCKVLVGDRVVAHVQGGVSKEEVKTKAAEEAVKVMSMEAGGAPQRGS